MAELQRAIAAGAEQLRREFSGPLAETLARVEAEGVELAGATRVLAESFAATSSAHREQLHSVFAREADALAATVASNADAFRRDFEAALAGADHAFVARGLDLARTLGARVAEMRALLVEEGCRWCRRSTRAAGICRARSKRRASARSAISSARPPA